MNKSCDNCYWKYQQPNNYGNKFCGFQMERPTDNTCGQHSAGCEHCKGDSYREIVRFEFKGEQYCESCMADKLGIERREYTGEQFYDSYGNFLGDSADMDLEDIFLKDSMIELLDE